MRVAAHAFRTVVLRCAPPLTPHTHTHRPSDTPPPPSRPQYDCPITRWYYSNEWTHNFLFLCWHLFYVGFYLQAAGCTYLGLPILALTALPALARLRCVWVVGKVQFLNIYEVDVLKHELKSSQVRLEEQKQQT